MDPPYLSLTRTLGVALCVPRSVQLCLVSLAPTAFFQPTSLSRPGPPEHGYLQFSYSGGSAATRQHYPGRNGKREKPFSANLRCLENREMTTILRTEIERAEADWEKTS